MLTVLNILTCLPSVFLGGSALGLILYWIDGLRGRARPDAPPKHMIMTVAPALLILACGWWVVVFTWIFP